MEEDVGLELMGFHLAELPPGHYDEVEGQMNLVPIKAEGGSYYWDDEVGFRSFDVDGNEITPTDESAE